MPLVPRPRQIHPFRPLNPAPSDSNDKRSSSLSKYVTNPDNVIHDKITPYIVGIELDSVLVDITDIRDLNELKSFLASHNTDTEFHFFGSLLLERKYLNRRFIETKWDTTSPHYKKLISEGLKADVYFKNSITLRYFR
jgi:hypothetical protein